MRRQIAAVATVGLLWAELLAAEPFAIVGATLHPIGGPEIPNGVLIVEGVRIRQLGASLALDPSVRTIDATGKHVYPGFIQPHSTLGLIEIGAVRATVDTTETGTVNANLRAETAFNADSFLLLPAMAGGVTTAHIAAAGGVYNGQSALVKLRGWNWQDMTLRSPVGFFMTYPQVTKPVSPFLRQSDEDFNKEKDAALKALRETWLAAAAYDKARQAAARNAAPAVEIDVVLEAFRPALEGSLPVFLRAFSRTQIEAALEWAKETKLRRFVLVSGPDAQYFAERLASENVAVILDGVLALPDRAWEPYDAAYAAAAKLHTAGVRFAIGDGDDPSNARNLPFHAAMAAAFGLPPQAALRAITLSAAEILGVDGELGSLAPAKRATFFVSTGDPLDIRTKIERVWVDGEEIDLKADRQWQLYDRYDHRPKPSAHGAHGE